MKSFLSFLRFILEVVKNKYKSTFTNGENNMANKNEVDPINRFGNLLQTMQDNRWKITLINLGTFALLILGILLAIVVQTPVASEWKELLLLLLGAFIGNYNKTAEFWFSNEDRDKLLVQKMDEEDDAPGTAKAEVDLKSKAK